MLISSHTKVTERADNIFSGLKTDNAENLKARNIYSGMKFDNP